MKKSKALFSHLLQNRLIALLSPKTAEQCLRTFETLAPLGISCEIALRTKAALSGIQAIMEKHPDALILAGTVMTASQADAALKAGVAGVISADYISAVVERCVAQDVMCIPGGITDVGKQLSQKASLYGCELDELREKYPYQWMHKLYPAITPTISFLGLPSAWQGPYPGLQVIYTGGIHAQNLGEVVKTDPRGIFCGSALTKDADDPVKMREEAEKWVRVVN